jgi:hypothetical protein
MTAPRAATVSSTVATTNPRDLKEGEQTHAASHLRRFLRATSSLLGGYWDSPSAAGSPAWSARIRFSIAAQPNAAVIAEWTRLHGRSVAPRYHHARAPRVLLAMLFPLITPPARESRAKPPCPSPARKWRNTAVERGTTAQHSRTVWRRLCQVPQVPSTPRWLSALSWRPRRRHQRHVRT